MIDVACKQYRGCADDVYRGSEMIPETVGDSGSSSRLLFRLSSHIDIEQVEKKMHEHIDRD